MGGTQHTGRLEDGWLMSNWTSVELDRRLVGRNLPHKVITHLDDLRVHAQRETFDTMMVWLTARGEIKDQTFMSFNVWYNVGMFAPRRRAFFFQDVDIAFEFKVRWG